MKNLSLVLFYNFIFLAFFFLGFDNYLIWERTFVTEKTYETVQYAHYGLSIFAGWLLGFALFQRTVNKYDSLTMIKYSFLLASFAAWCQYRTSMQAVDVQFSSMIVLNLVFNLAVSFLAYTLKKIAKEAKETSLVSKNSIIALLLAGISILFSYVFINKNLHFYFLCTSFIYLLAFLFFRFSPILKNLSPSIGAPTPSSGLSINRIKKKKEIDYTFSIGIILGLILLSIIAYLTKTNHIHALNKYCDTASFIYIFILAYILGKPFNKKFFIYMGAFALFLTLVTSLFRAL